MESINFIQQAGIILISGLVVSCIAGLFENELREVIGNFFGLLLRPLLLINNTLEKFWQGVRNFYKEQFTVSGRVDLQSVFFQFIGATLYTLFFLAFNFAEFHLLALSIAAAGIDVGQYEAPMGAGSLTALAVIASFLFWGAIICDLSGMTKTAPWRQSLDKKWRSYLLRLTIFCLCLSLFVTVTMGVFRGKVIADSSLEQTSFSLGTNQGLTGSNIIPVPDNNNYSDLSSPVTTDSLYYWIPIIANICIPILVGIGGVFASWGLINLIKFTMLIVGFIIISPLGLLFFVSNLSMNITERLYHLFDVIFQFFAAMGRKFMDLFGGGSSKPPSNKDQDDDSDSSDDTDQDTPDGPSDTEEPNDPQDDDTIPPPQDGWDPFNE